MYGKVFESMYGGTLSTNWKGLITFQQMIVLCDADGIIDITTSAISRHTGIPPDIIEEGIAFLELPDPDSRTPDLDGKRIVRLDDHRSWGWFIVNHSKYKALQDSDHVREQNRIRKQRQRDKERRSRNVTDGHALSRHTDTDTDTDNTASFDAFWSLYPKKVDKKKAQVAWKKLSMSKQKLAIFDIETRYQGVNKQYIPNPTNYIRGERWNDESIAVDEEESIFERAERSMR